MEIDMTNPWTPGPWRVQPGFLTVYSLSHGNVGLTCAIASVLKEQPEKGQPEANARLIAAAPELVELLAEIADDLEAETDGRFGFIGETSPYPSENQRKRRDMEPVVRARALLARIRGEK